MSANTKNSFAIIYVVLEIGVLKKMDDKPYETINEEMHEEYIRQERQEREATRQA